MPVDYQQIQTQVRDFGQEAFLRQKEIESFRQKGMALLETCTEHQAELAEKVNLAAQLNPRLRCAMPTHEPLNARLSVSAPLTDVTILAADGSQINPDRHARIEFCVINVGAVQIRMGSGAPPSTLVQSHLLGQNEMFTEDGLITEGVVALKRDLAERKTLMDLACQGLPPVITLTDGPLELYHEPNPSKEFDRAFEEYLEVLHKLSGTGAATAGYVDRPRSDLLVRLLELDELPESRLKTAGQTRRYQGLTDASLLLPLLPNPGDRSAVFAIQSQTSQSFGGSLALHFFYMNVGRPNIPYLARVEIPAWVAQDEVMLCRLHSVLFSQCSILGTRPYPYVLHRAHEVAVVSYDEKDQLESMLMSELIRLGMAAGETSNKQHHKQLQKRTRYGR